MRMGAVRMKPDGFLTAGMGMIGMADVGVQSQGRAEVQPGQRAKHAQACHPTMHALSERACQAPGQALFGA